MGPPLKGETLEMNAFEDKNVNALLETPFVPSELKTCTFTLDATVDGVTKTIGQGSPVRILLSPGLVNEATPSALNGAGTAFNDCAYKQSCAAPA